MRSPVRAFALLLLPFLAEPASAATITFNNQPETATFSSYSEAGFVVSATSGSWMASTTYGNPAPFIQFPGPIGASAIVGEVAVTAGAAPFSFAGVDLYSSVTPIPYMFTGFLNGSVVFSQSGTVPNTFGTFATVMSGTALAIDRLLISLSNPPIGVMCCTPNPMGLDNIRVNAVPEPDAVRLVGVGLTCLLVRRRRAH